MINIQIFTMCNYSICKVLFFGEILRIRYISGFIDVKYFTKEIAFSTEYNFHAQYTLTWLNLQQIDCSYICQVVGHLKV